jgi:hypothetical protein
VNFTAHANPPLAQALLLARCLPEGKNQMVDALRQLQIARQPPHQEDGEPAAQSEGSARARAGRVLLTDKAL